MKEGDSLAVGTVLGFIGEEAEAERSESSHLRLKVIHLERDVVKARPAFFEKPGHRRFRMECLEEFQLRRGSSFPAIPDEVCPHALMFDGFHFVWLRAKQLLEKLCGFGGVGNGDAEMFKRESWQRENGVQREDSRNHVIT